MASPRMTCEIAIKRPNGIARIPKHIPAYLPSAFLSLPLHS